MRDTDRIITESFTADMGTVVMDDVPYTPSRRLAHAQACWYGRRAPQLAYVTPERRALHERVLCAALALLNPHNRRR